MFNQLNPEGAVIGHGPPMDAPWSPTRHFVQVGPGEVQAALDALTTARTSCTVYASVQAVEWTYPELVGLLDGPGAHVTLDRLAGVVTAVQAPR